MAERAVHEARARPAVLPLVRAVPVWVWLTSLVGVSAIVRYELSRRMVGPWILVDELIYSELAKSFAATGHFLVREQPFSVGIVYPALISPAYRVFGSVPDAYAAVRAINSVLMSLAAVPAYLLARRVLGKPYALLAALLAVSIPSLVYTGTVMTENAFYPIFLLAALALVACLERPTMLRQVLLLAVCALAYLTRAQAIALVPALLTAPLLYAFAQRRGWRSLRDYRLLYGITVGAGLLVVAGQLARGRSFASLLGAYAAAGHVHYAIGATASWFLYHAAELDLYVGVVPFVAFLVLLGRVRRLSAPVSAFLTASLALSFWLLVEVAAFASAIPVPRRIEERNIFYLAPLLLIALLVWIEVGAPRPRWLFAGAAATAVLLPATIHFTELIGPPAVSDTLSLLPWWWLQDRWITLAEVKWTAVACAAALVLLMLLLPRRALLVLPALVLCIFAFVTWTVEDSVHGVKSASYGSLWAGIKVPQRDWIDRAVGRSATVAAVWSGSASPYGIWENEFFNRSVGPVYDLAGPLPGALPETGVTVSKTTGLLRGPGGKPVVARYVLADGSVTIDGKPVASDPREGLVVYRVGGSVYSVTRVAGLYPNDTWSGRRVVYTRLRCPGGRVVATLSSDPSLFASTQTVVARVGSRVVGRVRLQPTGTKTLSVPLVRHGSTCSVTYTVSPTAVPARVHPGSDDTRVLGAHFTGFRDEAPGA